MDNKNDAMCSECSMSCIGKHIEEMYFDKKIPNDFKVYGDTLEKIFRDAELLNNRYSDKLSYGAIALYSYLDRLSVGLQLFMTLNRKFELSLLNRSDLIPLTKDMSEIL